MVANIVFIVIFGIAGIVFTVASILVKALDADATVIWSLRCSAVVSWLVFLLFLAILLL